MEKKEQVFLYMKEEIERLASKEEEKILNAAYAYEQKTNFRKTYQPEFKK